MIRDAENQFLLSLQRCPMVETVNFEFYYKINPQLLSQIILNCCNNPQSCLK